MSSSTAYLLMSEVSFRNSKIEGDFQIKSLVSVRISKTASSVFFFFCVFSLGLLALLLKWSKRLKYFFLYKKCLLSEASEIAITTQGASFDIVPLIREEHGKKRSYSFLYKLLKYHYDEEVGYFEPVDFSDINSKRFRELFLRFSKGIDEETARFHLQKFGENLKLIPIPNIFEYLYQEMTAPFYILQYFSALVWCLEKAYIYSITLLVATFVLTIVGYFFVRSSQAKIQELAHYDVDVKVFRKGKYETISSKYLVPGDLFALESNMKLPCDVLLISGEAIINESMLTGESIPIAKFPIETCPDTIFDYEVHKRHIVFEGTNVLQLKTGNRNKFVYALAIRTAFTSLKGQMIRSILFPHHKIDKFFRQAVKFLFTYLTICLCLYFEMLSQMLKHSLPLGLCILRFADTLIGVFPPALNVYFQFPINFSIYRLKNKGVLGLQPQKMREAGSIRICCFDKTGTLTENGMGVYGVYEKNGDQSMRMTLANEVKPQDVTEKIIFKLMATCHNVYMIDGELMGDILEIKMMEFSGWRFFPSEKDHVIFDVQAPNKQYLEVWKIFEFESEFQCMSTIVHDNDQETLYAFTKGAPEKMMKICKAESIPHHYNTIMEGLAIKGFRVLALAYKILKKKPESLLTLRREEVETDLCFLGFLILENKMKEDTADVMKRLKKAELALKIISGDNPLTTIQAAKESCVIPEDKTVVLIDVTDFPENKLKFKEIHPRSQSVMTEESPTHFKFIKAKPSPNRSSRKQREESFNEDIEMNTFSYSNFNTMDENSDDLEKLSNMFLSPNDFEFAITGPFYEFLNSFQTSSLQKAILLKTKVFSRIKPDQKGKIVESLRNVLKVGVAMVGDGANDCQALKKADIGISFTQADASFAAPFTSIDLSISCLEKVLLEGRACLTALVEVFMYTECFNFLLIFSSMILTQNVSHHNDFQYIIYVFMIVLPLTISFGLSVPTSKLTHHFPDFNLFGKYNVFQIYGLMLIAAFTICSSYILLTRQEFYDFHIYFENGAFGDSNPENTVMYFGCVYFLLGYPLIILSSKPFKERVFKNHAVMALVIFNCVYAIISNFSFECAIPRLKLVDFELSFKFKFFSIYAFGLALSAAFIYILRRMKLKFENSNLIEIEKC